MGYRGQMKEGNPWSGFPVSSAITPYGEGLKVKKPFADPRPPRPALNSDPRIHHTAPSCDDILAPFQRHHLPTCHLPILATEMLVAKKLYKHWKLQMHPPPAI